jgi:hypothetical protein
MYADDATIEAQQLQLPPDLLSEVSRRGSGRHADFGVDAWKPSLLERLARLFGLGSARGAR